MKKNRVPADQTRSRQEYVQCFEQIKGDIAQSQISAALAVSKELIMLYWRIGTIVSTTIGSHEQDAMLIADLAKDLESVLPGVAGFSLRNLRYMKKFAATYPDPLIAAIVAKLPWGHNIVLMEQLKDNDQRLWYAAQAIEHGWGRSMLEMWIKSNLYHRQGKAITNFSTALIPPHSDLAQQTLKDPYNFDFLTLHKDASERDIEQALMKNIQKTMLEMGKGFAFIGQQYHVAVGNKDYYIDLLFYHVPLKRYFVIELKAREFNYLDAGQISFYITAIDEQLKTKDDNPTIGLILCKNKDHYTAEYALKGTSQPIGIASYELELISKLPKEWTSSLPTIEEIETELEKKAMLQTIE